MLKIVVVCACRIFHNINRTEAVTLDKDLVCSGQGGRLRFFFHILNQMACHAEQGSCMFKAAGQFHLFQNPAGAYFNIIVSGAEAVTLDKDLVCSGQSSDSFCQTVYFFLIQIANYTEQRSCMFRAV